MGTFVIWTCLILAVFAAILVMFLLDGDLDLPKSAGVLVGCVLYKLRIPVKIMSPAVFTMYALYLLGREYGSEGVVVKDRFNKRKVILIQDGGVDVCILCLKRSARVLPSCVREADRLVEMYGTDIGAICSNMPFSIPAEAECAELGIEPIEVRDLI